MRILVVEDDNDLARMLCESLEDLGHLIERASNAPMALALADTFEPDAVVIDIVLPVFDGNEIAAGIRRASHAPPRLVAITGMQERVADGLFDAVVLKPFAADELCTVLVGTAMSSSSATRQATRDDDADEDTAP